MQVVLIADDVHLVKVVTKANDVHIVTVATKVDDVPLKQVVTKANDMLQYVVTIGDDLLLNKVVYQLPLILTIVARCLINVVYLTACAFIRS